MPDKFYKKGCGTGCTRCWRNKLKHANPTAKKFLAKEDKKTIIVKEDRDEPDPTPDPPKVIESIYY